MNLEKLVRLYQHKGWLGEDNYQLLCDINMTIDTAKKQPAIGRNSEGVFYTWISHTKHGVRWIISDDVFGWIADNTFYGHINKVPTVSQTQDVHICGVKMLNEQVITFEQICEGLLKINWGELSRIFQRLIPRAIEWDMRTKNPIRKLIDPGNSYYKLNNYEHRVGDSVYVHLRDVGHVDIKFVWMFKYLFAAPNFRSCDNYHLVFEEEDDFGQFINMMLELF